MVPPDRMARVSDLIQAAISTGGVTAATTRSSGSGSGAAGSSANAAQTSSQSSVFSFLNTVVSSTTAQCLAHSLRHDWVYSCRPAMHRWKRSLLPEWITLVSEVSLGIGRGGDRYKHRHRLGHINIHTHIHKLVHRPLHIQHELICLATAVSTDPCVDTTTGKCMFFPGACSRMVRYGMVCVPLVNV